MQSDLQLFDTVLQRLFVWHELASLDMDWHHLMLFDTWGPCQCQKNRGLGTVGAIRQAIHEGAQSCLTSVRPCLPVKGIAYFAFRYLLHHGGSCPESGECLASPPMPGTV